MINFIRKCVVLMVAVLTMLAQEPASSPNKPGQRITGTITAVDQQAHSITVTEDKTGTVYVVELQNTKSLRRVDPSTLDLKNATRIKAEDLAVGDRVQVFASAAEDNPHAFAARGVILMSARDLESVHQEQAAAWQHSTRGVVTSVDAGGGKLGVSARTPEGPKPLVIEAANANFTRYSSDDPKTPASSKLADIQPGDQVRILGETSADGSSIAARSVYSSPVRMLLCTVSAVSADGKQITAKDLQKKQPVVISLNDGSAVRKLPPMLAYGFARRLNPSFKPGAGGGPGAGSAPASSAGSETAGSPASQAGGASGGFGPRGEGRGGDLSQMLERLPKISATDLKPGDAVVVSGVPGRNDNSRFAASNVIAGVEPIFQSASPRQMESLGDWGASLGGGAGEGGMSPQ